MKFDLPPTKPSYGDQLIPMINVVFLLLIFFMIAGTLRAPDPEGLLAPTSNQENTATVDTVLYVDKNGQFTFQGETIEAIELSRILAERDEANEITKTTMPVMFDKAMSMTVFTNVLETLRNTSLDQVELVTEFNASATE